MKQTTDFTDNTDFANRRHGRWSRDRIRGIRVIRGFLLHTAKPLRKLKSPIGVKPRSSVANELSASFGGIDAERNEFRSTG
jgi:hypothetical protein